MPPSWEFLHQQGAVSDNQAVRNLTLCAQVWDVPLGWSLLDAATVPVAYLTCYYALVMRGGLRRGQRVLVHSGSGAVGLAAIRIARSRGCEVRVQGLLWV